MTDRMEMRVRIAKDVLKLMRPAKKEEKRPRLNVSNDGVYFGFNVLKKNLPKQSDKEQDEVEVELRDLMPRKTCEVCALGALFAAEVWRNDKQTVVVDYEYRSIELDRRDVTDRLNKYFTKKEMDCIEYWFEASYFDNIGDAAKIVDTANYTFREGDSSGKDRLKFLLEFIIENEGELNWTKFLKQAEKS